MSSRPLASTGSETPTKSVPKVAQPIKKPMPVVQAPLVRVGKFGMALRMAHCVKKYEKPNFVTTQNDPTAKAAVPPTNADIEERTGEAPDVPQKIMAATKKKRRESENAIAPGGLRTPWRYVTAQPRSRQVGLKIASVIDKFVESHPHITDQLLEEGQAGRDKLKNSGEEDELAGIVAALLGTSDISKGPRSKWRAAVVAAYVAKAQDPDHQLAKWLREGAPAGVAREIEACGVFPRVENTAEANTELHKFYARTGTRQNYKSAEENAHLVTKELKRIQTEGYVNEYGTWDQVQATFGNVIVSRLAAILKTKEDGSIKVRLIMDMLRSHINSFVKLHERVVLPRLMDVVSDLVSIACAEAMPMSEAEIIDMMVLDFKDAFHSMGVAKEELPYQIFRMPGSDRYAGYDTVVFGGGGAGLVWSRGGALLSRSGQALFSPTEARIEVYVDDPWTAWRGTRERIRTMKVRLLLWWIVLGPEISWGKVQHGDAVKWIGANVIVNARRSVTLALPDEYAMELKVETLACMKLLATPVTRIQCLAGKVSWVSGFIPAVGSMIAPLWAAIADCKAMRSSQPSAMLIPAVRIRHALLWIIAFTTRERGTLKREFKFANHKKMGTISMEFDASPWGYGGVLFWCGRPWSFFAEPVSALDIERFGIEVGSSSYQALLETIAVLVGVRAWLPLWKDDRLTIRIRSDSAAALGSIRRQKSSNANVNAVVRELALDLAEGLYQIDVTEHLPGKCNTWADPLSRLWQPGTKATIPAGLEAVGRQAIQARDDAWWRTSGDPIAYEDLS